VVTDSPYRRSAERTPIAPRFPAPTKSKSHPWTTESQRTHPPWHYEAWWREARRQEWRAIAWEFLLRLLFLRWWSW
jgi:hypothetical protein